MLAATKSLCLLIRLSLKTHWYYGWNIVGVSPVFQGFCLGLSSFHILCGLGIGGLGIGGLGIGGLGSGSMTKAWL